MDPCKWCACFFSSFSYSTYKVWALPKKFTAAALMYCKQSNFVIFCFSALFHVLSVTLFCMNFPVCLASSLFEGRASFSKSQNLYYCRQVDRNHPNKSFSFSWRMWRSSHRGHGREGKSNKSHCHGGCWQLACVSYLPSSLACTDKTY